MYRRYRPKRKNSGHALPIAAVSLTLITLLVWGYFAVGDDIAEYFKGKTVVVADASEANGKLDALMADLYGSRQQLLELAEKRQTRLGWIADANTRRQITWSLVNRLVDEGEWNTAKPIVPEVTGIIPMDGLERIAIFLQKKGETVDQVIIEEMLQKRISDETVNAETLPLLIGSVSRYVVACSDKNKIYSALDSFRRIEVKTLLKGRPDLVVQVATLMLNYGTEDMDTEASNLLDESGCPDCPASAELQLKQAERALENKKCPNELLNRIHATLNKVQATLLKYPDTKKLLPVCYSKLGEVCFRLGKYDDCVKFLTLSDAFARGYGLCEDKLNAQQLAHTRTRAQANAARGAIVEAVVDYRYLLEHETATDAVFKSLTFIAEHSQGEERISLLMRCREMLMATPDLAKHCPWSQADITKEISDFYIAADKYEDALPWVQESLALVEAAHKNEADGKIDLSDGLVLRSRLNLALLERKTEKRDEQALERIKLVVRAMETMDKEDKETRAKLDEADPKLYKEAVREFARTYLVMGGKYNEKLAREVMKKIKESLPSKVR